MKLLDAKWYKEVIARRRKNIKDCKEQIEFSDRQVAFWVEFGKRERDWLKECEKALDEALAWKEEYTNENSHL